MQENGTMQKFEELRNSCPALRTILIPNSHWEEFKLKATEEPNDAFHNYIVWIAFEYGNLHKLTTPIHDFLLNDDGTLKSNLNKHYSFPEFWMSKDNTFERHKKVKSYCGKLYELLIAKFLENKNWTDMHLEALGAEHDIIA
ncbi:MAG: hypothetical protein GF353_27245, partial [Candidatus Lokiarchaeota archaeon]|nr:hypothetical protein [Candidatus Lokiarchaeota archaeon]